MSRRRARPGRRPDPVAVTVERLGAKGDGIGAGDDGRRYYVPFTLPGDRLNVRPGRTKGDGVAGTPEDWQQQTTRAEPFCRHFGTCGGCAVQHVPAADYRAWKRDLVAEALAKRGFADIPVAECLEVPRAARRRAAVAFVRTARGLVLGFQKRESHDIVDIESCPLLRPSLNGLLARLRVFVEAALSDVRRGRLTVTEVGTDDAPAVDVICQAEAAPGLAAREAMAAFAQEHDLARLCWQEDDLPPEPVAQRRDVEAVFDGLGVALPPGAFLQPSVEGEGHLRRLVEQGVGDGRRVADLYSGLGTFALPLARGRHVWAVDGDGPAIAALTAAAGRHGLGGRLVAEARDLARRPVTAAELDRAEIDTVVFDPPRAGAKLQAEEIAASTGVSRAVGVSCQPATFARDARLLADGGFALETVTPVDQFPFSHHVELVGSFRRR